MGDGHVCKWRHEVTASGNGDTLWIQVC